MQVGPQAPGGVALPGKSGRRRRPPPGRWPGVQLRAPAGQAAARGRRRAALNPAGTLRRRGVEAVPVGRRTRKCRAPYARVPWRGQSSERKAAAARRRALRVEQRLVPDREPHIPPVSLAGVELCLSPLPPLLQWRSHLRRNPRRPIKCQCMAAPPDSGAAGSGPSGGVLASACVLLVRHPPAYATPPSSVVVNMRGGESRGSGLKWVRDLLGCVVPMLRPCGVAINILVDLIKLAGESPGLKGLVSRPEDAESLVAISPSGTSSGQSSPLIGPLSAARSARGHCQRSRPYWWFGNDAAGRSCKRRPPLALP